MLISLHVKNLALIEETEVFFGEGLNILTGETGAGKSVILGSVALALGAKADKDMIRTGAESALIELTFTADEAVRSFMAQIDMPLEEEELVLSRRILPGRSVCRVNGETVSAKILKELAGLLIDIHGQHDSQVLLQTKRHLDILDSYAAGTLAGKKEQLKKLWQQYTAIERELEENTLDEAARRRELSLAQFELDEIESANLMEGEDEQLEKDYRLMVNSKKITGVLGNVYGITGYDNSESCGDGIGRALRELSGIASYDERLDELYGQLSDVDALLNDFNRSVSDYLSDFEFDEETFYETEKRLDVVNRLKDKYGRTITEVLQYAAQKQLEVERLLNQDAWVEKKRSERDRAQKEMLKLAAEVSNLRKKAADAFEKDMCNALQDMNFLHVEFAVSLKEKEYCTAEGIDDAVFLISTNPGEPMKPLAAIASGGELSRIMLALKTITARQEQIGTLIFDEIDAGISGKTAWAVSDKLGILSKNTQVICITHLPQIAAMADRHFYIEKNAYHDTTATTITSLNREESLQELARLSGAAEFTEETLQSARKMKELAEKNKEK
ncbi:MAG: DNA repair protein RecN [Lachnospiraceae bacterium]|nr:DNA repair protein RecN [Lachnospiraceae bacterium]